MYVPPKYPWLSRRERLRMTWEALAPALAGKTVCRLVGHVPKFKMSGSFCDRCGKSMPRQEGNTAWKALDRVAGRKVIHCEFCGDNFRMGALHFCAGRKS